MSFLWKSAADLWYLVLENWEKGPWKSWKSPWIISGSLCTNPVTWKFQFNWRLCMCACTLLVDVTLLTCLTLSHLCLFFLFSLFFLSLSDYDMVFSDDRSESAQNLDPGKEDCDMNVKIADLGNACWTVSWKTSYSERLELVVTVAG